MCVFANVVWVCVPYRNKSRDGFTGETSLVQGGAKRTHVFFLNLPAISFFGVTSNQKSMFENLVQSTI